MDRMEPTDGKEALSEMKILQVQYAITDVVVMVREVADHQVITIFKMVKSVVIKFDHLKDILRSLAKTVLVRLLAKKQVSHQD